MEEEKKIETMKSCKSILTGYLDTLERRVECENSYLKTGFASLDDAFGAIFFEGNFVVLAARPGMGKTSLGLQISEIAALEKTVIFYSLEMTSEQLLERSISRRTGITVDKLRTGSLEDDDFPKIGNVLQEIAELELYIDDGTYYIDEIVAKTKAVNQKILSNISDDKKNDSGELNPPLGLVVIDYLQLMRGIIQNNRTELISDISRKLAALSKELGVPVIAISQLNRNLEQRPDKRPMASDLRESGQIEQDADVILFVYRDEVYNDDSPDKGIAEVICGKNRNGPMGTARMLFFGPKMEFSDLLNYSYESSVSSKVDNKKDTKLEGRF